MIYETWRSAMVIPILVIVTTKVGVGFLVYLADRRRWRQGRRAPPHRGPDELHEPV